jgi:hypothetical protein
MSSTQGDCINRSFVICSTDNELIDEEKINNLLEKRDGSFIVAKDGTNNDDKEQFKKF